MINRQSHHGLVALEGYQIGSEPAPNSRYGTIQYGTNLETWVLQTSEALDGDGTLCLTIGCDTKRGLYVRLFNTSPADTDHQFSVVTDMGEFEFLRSTKADRMPLDFGIMGNEAARFIRAASGAETLRISVQHRGETLREARFDGKLITSTQVQGNIEHAIWESDTKRRRVVVREALTPFQRLWNLSRHRMVEYFIALALPVVNGLSWVLDRFKRLDDRVAKVVGGALLIGTLVLITATVTAPQFEDAAHFLSISDDLPNEISWPLGGLFSAVAMIWFVFKSR